MESCLNCGHKYLPGSGAVCYNCERIRDEHRRFGKRRRIATTSSRVIFAVSENDSLRYQAQGINRFLKELYGRPRLISEILPSFGRGNMTRIKKHRVEFQREICRQWIQIFEEFLGKAQADLVCNHFSLNGMPTRYLQVSPRLEKIVDELRGKMDRIEDVVIAAASCFSKI